MDRPSLGAGPRLMGGVTGVHDCVTFCGVFFCGNLSVLGPYSTERAYISLRCVGLVRYMNTRAVLCGIINLY